MKLYDDIFRTLSEKNSKLLIPIINAVFSTDYDMDAKLDLLSGEHHILPNADTHDTGEIITDSCIRLKDKLYHIECQSYPDGSMILRMVEYDFYIALENVKKAGDVYEMEFPHSAVLYLRHTENTPDSLKMKIKFPNDESVLYEVPIIKTQDFSVDDIMKKKLFFIIPYYIFKYEKSYDYNTLINEYLKLYDGIKKAHDRNEINLYDMTNIIEYTNKMAEHIFPDNEDVRKEVASMGGTVLETYADKCEKKAQAKVQAAIEKIQAEAKAAAQAEMQAAQAEMQAEAQAKAQAAAQAAKKEAKKEFVFYLIEQGKNDQEIIQIAHISEENLQELRSEK